MLHETSIGDGKEVFLQKNKKKEKELTFYAIRGLIHGIYWSPTFDFANRNELPNLVPRVHSYPPYGARGREGKFQQEKRLAKVLGDLSFLGQKSVENGPLYHCLDVRKSQERQASKKFYSKCSENSRSLIVFRTGIFRKLTLSAPVYIKVQRKPFT